MASPVLIAALLRSTDLTADRARVLGSYHPDTLDTRRWFAYAVRAAGDCRRAIALFETVLADVTRVQGAEHVDTLACRDGLGFARQVAGQHAAAVREMEALVADRTRIQGADHAATLTSRANLAYACRDAGDDTRAVSLYEELVTDVSRVRGSNHGDTLYARSALALTLATMSSHSTGRAVSLCETLVVDHIRAFGADHRKSLSSREQLAYVCLRAGDAHRAITLFEDVIADRSRVLGLGYPDTSDGIAAAHEQGQDALPTVTSCWTRILNLSDPTVIDALAQAYGEAGDWVRAAALFTAVASGRRQVLGDDHPDTLESRTGAVFARAAAGDVQGTSTTGLRLITGWERVLGPNHPRVRNVRQRMASLRAPGDLG